MADEWTADGYMAAASDHANALSRLYEGGHHALAVYTSGLAAECLFRAFRHRKGLPFTSDHKLANLAQEAGFPDLVPERDRVEFDAAISQLVAAWQNSHRFRSDEAMRRFLKQAKLDQGIKGDYLRENARRLASGALPLISLGVKRWTR